MTVRYLTLAQLMAVATRVCDGEPTVRDWGLLSAALDRPRASAFGADAYSTLHLKAAALLHSLCTNHALVDGNKRLAIGAAIVFLDINGGFGHQSIDELFDLTMAVADGSLTDVRAIAARLAPEQPI